MNIIFYLLIHSRIKMKKKKKKLIKQWSSLNVSSRLSENWQKTPLCILHFTTLIHLLFIEQMSHLSVQKSDSFEFLKKCLLHQKRSYFTIKNCDIDKQKWKFKIFFDWCPDFIGFEMISLFYDMSLIKGQMLVFM